MPSRNVLSHEQRMASLARANEVRILKANDKREIRYGRLDPRSILRDPPPHWQNAPIGELLLSVPRVGRARMDNWLKIRRIAATRPLSGLTAHERASLAGTLEMVLGWRQTQRMAAQMDSARA